LAGAFASLMVAFDIFDFIDGSGLDLLLDLAGMLPLVLIELIEAPLF